MSTAIQVPEELVTRWRSAFAEFERCLVAEHRAPADHRTALAASTSAQQLSEAWRALAAAPGLPVWVAVALRIAERHANDEATYWDKRRSLLALRPWWAFDWLMPRWARRRS